MPARPHHISDLYLAPMALEVDARIEQLGRLDKEGWPTRSPSKAIRRTSPAK
jgi:hypothetical protein